MSLYLFRVALVLVCGALVGCGGAREFRPLPQPDGAPPPAAPAEPAEADPEPYQPEVIAEPAPDPLAGIPTERRARIRWVQTRLNERGFGCGDADGSIGPNTRRCIRAFRLDAGLSDSTEIDDDLLALLNLPD